MTVDYKITFAKSARKELASLNSAMVNRIVPKIESLSYEPRPIGCRKLKGAKNLWRIRIGDYRVIYAVYDVGRIVDVTAVRLRGKAYE